MKCVIDASFVAAVILPDEATDRMTALAKTLERDQTAAPALLQLEVTNILLMARRRRRINGTQLKQLSDAFERFPVTYQPSLTAQQRAAVLSLAEKHTITAYDAAYLELAMRLDLILASLDDSLIKAAKAEGVKIAG
jgi:predicted nucleic acid-binding protein